MIEHAVKGRSAKTGRWIHIAPDCKYSTVGWWIFKVTYKVPAHGRLTKTKALKIAEETFASEEYQDVIILQDNEGEEYGEYMPTCIWQNGRWCEYEVDMDIYD